MPAEGSSPVIAGLYQYDTDPFGWFRITHGDMPLANLITTHKFLERIGGFFEPLDFTRSEYPMQERNCGLALLRSHLWRAKRRGISALRVVTSDDLESQLADPIAIKQGVRSFDQYVNEAQSLTFIDKAMRTLENLEALAHDAADGILSLPYAVGEKWPPAFSHAGRTEEGLTYGCGELEAAQVYRYLVREGHLEFAPVKKGNWCCQLGCNAFMELDRMRKGATTIGRSAFLVVRFDEELNAFLTSVLTEVEQVLGCSIRPVWGKEHNDRIDERIFRSIREAAVVVVDVTPDRFNVGLELGYALALGKPIVLVMEKLKSLPTDRPEDEWKRRLPFDIQTLNCYFYERENRHELVEKLVARIGLALDLLALK